MTLTSCVFYFIYNNYYDYVSLSIIIHAANCEMNITSALTDQSDDRRVFL